jgi:hypothetical protein
MTNFKFKPGDRVWYTPLGENRRSWLGTIVEDPNEDFPFVDDNGETVYLFLADETTTGRPLPECESQLKLATEPA